MQFRLREQKTENRVRSFDNFYVPSSNFFLTTSLEKEEEKEVGNKKMEYMFFILRRFYI